MKKCFCDKCGQVIDNGKSIKVSMYPENEIMYLLHTSYIKNYDLCEDCAKAVIGFIDGGRR